MSFIKRNQEGRSTGIDIMYVFRKEGDLWKGAYGWNGDLHGEAICELFPSGKEPKSNWERILHTATLSLEAEEMWAERMVREMIEEGILMTYEDEDGKEYVIPSPDYLQN